MRLPGLFAPQGRGLLSSRCVAPFCTKNPSMDSWKNWHKIGIKQVYMWHEFSWNLPGILLKILVCPPSTFLVTLLFDLTRYVP
jgi:hypothetical protein